MADSTTEAKAPTKTETLIAACAKAKGATVEEIMAATGQTKQVTRSRIFTLTKAGRLEPIADSEPRRYKKVKQAAAKKAS